MACMQGSTHACQLCATVLLIALNYEEFLKDHKMSEEDTLEERVVYHRFHFMHALYQTSFLSDL